MSENSVPSSSASTTLTQTQLSKSKIDRLTSPKSVQSPNCRKKMAAKTPMKQNVNEKTKEQECILDLDPDFRTSPLRVNRKHSKKDNPYNLAPDRQIRPLSHHRRHHDDAGKRKRQHLKTSRESQAWTDSDSNDRPRTAEQQKPKKMRFSCA